MSYVACASTDAEVILRADIPKSSLIERMQKIDFVGLCLYQRSKVLDIIDPGEASTMFDLISEEVELLHIEMAHVQFVAAEFYHAFKNYCERIGMVANFLNARAATPDTIEPDEAKTMFLLLKDAFVTFENIVFETVH